MSRPPSHCRSCGMMFPLVEQSEVPNLCINCLPHFDTLLSVPEYYYCESCHCFCLIDDPQHYTSYSWSSYPYCYGCDPNWEDDD